MHNPRHIQSLEYTHPNTFAPLHMSSREVYRYTRAPMCIPISNSEEHIQEIEFDIALHFSSCKPRRNIVLVDTSKRKRIERNGKTDLGKRRIASA